MCVYENRFRSRSLFTSGFSPQLDYASVCTEKKTHPNRVRFVCFIRLFLIFFLSFSSFFFSRYFRLGSMRSLFAFFPLPLSRMQSTKSCNVWWSNRFWCDKSLECDFLLVRTKNAMNHVCIWSRSQVVPLLYAKWNYFKRTNRLFSIH